MESLRVDPEVEDAAGLPKVVKHKWPGWIEWLIKR